MSDAESKPEEIKDDDHWTNGDFEVVTADNVRFHIPSYYLLAHSTVLRELYELEPSKEKKISLCDTTFETAAVLRWFLELATSGKVTMPDLWFPRLHLAQFLKKWDCQCLRETYLLLLSDGLRTNVGPLLAFVVAAELACHKTCVRALDAAPRHWEMGSTELSGASDANVLDPSGWPLDVFSRVPHTYVWALGRAFNDRRTPTRKGPTFNLILSDTFLKYLSDATSATV